MVSKTFKIFLCTILLISIVGFSMSFVSAADVDDNCVIDSQVMVPVSVDTNYISDSSVCSQGNDISLKDSNSLSNSNHSVSNLKESGVSPIAEKLDDNKNKPSSNKKLFDDKDKSKKFTQQDNLGDVDSINDVNPNVATAMASASFAKDTACSTKNIVGSSKNNVYFTMNNIYGAVSDIKSNINYCIKPSNINSILPYYATSLNWLL